MRKCVHYGEQTWESQATNEWICLLRTGTYLQQTSVLKTQLKSTCQKLNHHRTRILFSTTGNVLKDFVSSLMWLNISRHTRKIVAINTPSTTKSRKHGTGLDGKEGHLLNNSFKESPRRSTLVQCCYTSRSTKRRKPDRNSVRLFIIVRMKNVIETHITGNM